MSYIASAVLATVMPRSCPLSEDAAAYFESRTGLQPSLTFDTASAVVSASLTRPNQTAVSEDQRVVLVLHGEVYGGMGATPCAHLLRAYMQRGVEFARDVHGSFAMLIVDKRDDRILLITDRVNSRKVFHSQIDGVHWISTAQSYCLYPLSDGRLDSVAVAEYLVNGMCYNDRTLFASVRVLERASVHRFGLEGLESTRYWEYEFDNAHAGRDTHSLRLEMADLVLEGVRRRLSGRGRTLLSLSAGYDSTCILGCLRTLGIADVDCFTYVLGEMRPGTDAYHAMQMAQQAGYSHRVISGYKDGFVEGLQYNAEMGQGMVTVVHETDVWRGLGEELSTVESSSLFVGEERMGWGDDALRNERDVLATLPLRGPEGLAWLRDRISRETFETMSEGMEADLSQMLRRSPSSGDLHDKKDFLHLDQRLSKLLSWREFFAAPFTDVREPLLDNDILDFVSSLPSTMRLNKRLFKETVTWMFPDLFETGRAAPASAGIETTQQWFSSDNPEIEEMLSRDSSPLDEFIPPQLLLGLLRNRSSGSSGLSTYRRAKSSRNGVMSKARGLRKWIPRSLVPVRIGGPSSQTVFLKRALLLRLFLSTRLQQADYRANGTGSRTPTVSLD